MPTRYLRYRRTLTARAQSLRRDPTPAERLRFTNEDVAERFEAVCAEIRRVLRA